MSFMLRELLPLEQTQTIMYRQLLSMFTPKPVVIRTLDGGDKGLIIFRLRKIIHF